MSSVPSPAELRNTKQPIPTDKLIRWAEDSGFEVRLSQGSHILCTHTVFPDIIFGLIRNNKKPTSQRELSDALVRLEDRRSAKRESFAKAAEQKITDQYAKLPEYLSVEHDFEKAVSVVRYKVLPQIGVTIPFAEAHMLENKIRNIVEPNKREAYILLSRARMIYDITTGMDKGEFNGALGHSIYKISAPELPPYRAGENPAKLFEHLHDFIWKVLEKDQAHDTRLDTLLRNEFAGAVKVVYHTRRGERTNHVPLTKPDGSRFMLKFETASNRRADTGDVHMGRISEEELARVEKVIGGLDFAHAHRAPAARAA